MCYGLTSHLPSFYLSTFTFLFTLLLFLNFIMFYDFLKIAINKDVPAIEYLVTDHAKHCDIKPNQSFIIISNSFRGWLTEIS